MKKIPSFPKEYYLYHCFSEYHQKLSRIAQRQVHFKWAAPTMLWVWGKRKK